MTRLNIFITALSFMLGVIAALFIYAAIAPDKEPREFVNCAVSTNQSSDLCTSK